MAVTSTAMTSGGSQNSKTKESLFLSLGISPEMNEERAGLVRL